jgi:hypothetical protein
MGGKTSKSTQAITIPPEVLARYNAVNARADAVTTKPYQYYGGQFVAPLTATQQSGIANTNAAAGMAQPYFGAATNQLMGAQQAAVPYYQGATNQLNQGINAGNQFAGQSSNTINAAQSQGAGIQQNALNDLGAAYSSAQPYNAEAGSLYQQGLGQGSSITGQALSGTQQALSGAQPYQGMATNYMNSGAQAVNPYDLGADQINKYMSPYLDTVLQGTAGLLNQQNQQQQAGQMGNAIRSGAFGGDRGGIAAANLNQQQNLANSKIYSDILNQGFGQALGTAQQQQQLSLGAQQANRAAQQQASQQALAIGQQGFGQGLSAAQQQGALGQQLFNMNSTTGQNTAALGQQVYGQGTNTAQQQSAVGNTLFNQGATTAAQQAALGQQQFAQGATASQQAAALGQGLYGMGANTSSQLAGLGTGAQGAALSGAGAQLAAGQVDQATQQAENTAKYNEFLQAQSLPYQQLKLASDIALGTGTASGSTTTTAQPGGFFSDERLKENIKAVGKTFDGQTIHSYNYKGDPRTQIGLIAQEVQKHHPEAVGLAGGYKTVDYDKATEDASDRGHMASGGLASAGGSVMPYNAGQGFADGGFAGFDPATMQQMLAAQQAMYAPLSSNNMYAGGPNAGGGLVPQSTFTQGQLMVPAELARQATGAEKAKTIVDLGKSVNEFGEGIGVFGKDKKPKDKNPEDEKNDGSYKYIEDEILNRALGGGIPYSGQGLDIPESGLAAGSGSPMTASALQAQQSGIQKLGDTADTGMKLFKAGKKLSKLFADGGGIPYAGQGLDIPDEDDSSKTYQLPTAGDMPDKPKSGFSKAVKVAGTVAKIASMFSDKRMKENIKPVGKLFDGQIVHSYNYKGDPRTQIGLIAQEVEGHKPHAVGLAGKYKTVDYDKATSGAAKRGHFAMGGEPAAGLMGAEMMVPDENEQGFDFNLDPEDLIAGGDSQFESLLRRKPEDVPQHDNGFAASNEKFRKEMEARKNAPRGMGLAGAPKPAGLAPTAVSLPKDLSTIAKLIFAAEGDGPVSTSSALGRYGIIKGTYVDYFKKAFPQQARELGDAGIRALRTTPEGRKLNLQFGPMIIADNAKSLSKAGFDTNARNVYLAHFLGPAGAVRALRADLNTPVELAVDKDSIDANYNVFVKRNIRTVGDLLNWSNSTMAKRAQEMSRGPRALGGLAGRHGYALDGTVEDNAQATDQLNGLAEAERQRLESVAAGGDDEAPPIAAATAPTALAAAEKPVEEILVTAQPDPRGKPQPAMRKTIYGRGKQEPISLEGGSIAPFNYDYTSEPFFKGIKRGSAGSIIPLLTGIAAMGTAPTRSLGVALATGLGAGAQSYQNLSSERNKQLPIRQAAAAKQAEVARTLADQFFRLAPDGINFTFTKPGGETILITPGQKQDMLRQMVTGSGQYMPDAPEGAQAFNPNKAVRDVVKFKSTVPASNDNVEGIIAGANANPTVAQYFNDRAQAQADMDTQQRMMDSQYASEKDIGLAQARFVAAQTRFAAADKQYFEALSKVADPKLQSLNTSLANIGSVNVETYGKAQDRVLAYEPVKAILSELNKSGFGGGATSTFWNNLASAALAFGVPKEIVGTGQEASQRQAALSALLAGTGISPAALSVENDPAAIEAVVNALNKAISTADYQSQQAGKALRATATPQLNQATGAPLPPPAAPRAAPAAAAPSGASPSGYKPMSGSTPERPMGTVSSLQAAMNDPAIRNGTVVFYRGADGRVTSTTITGKK